MKRCRRTDSEWGPWTIVEATDRRFTKVKITKTILSALEERLGPIPEFEVPQKKEGGPVETEPETAGLLQTEAEGSLEEESSDGAIVGEPSVSSDGGKPADSKDAEGGR
jgi:hypothetical protein